MKVLVVDDDAEMREFLSELLEGYGHSAVTCGSVTEAKSHLAAAPAGEFDVVVLDVVLSGVNGWQLVVELREEGDPTPVVFLTASSSEDDRVRGLRLGGDDYICKPFRNNELLARLEAVVRRHRCLPVLSHGELRIDLGRRVVERAGGRIDLSPIEFDLVRCLTEARGRTVSRAEILNRVWDLDCDPGTGVLDVTVARLRRKLDLGREPLLRTVVGTGYRLEPCEQQLRSA